MKNPNATYFRLGLFVLIGLIIAIAMTVIFSSGKLFKKTYIVETYLVGSVTGLDVGAAVRYRGVRVGKITSIQLSSALYEYKKNQLDRKDYVVVRMEIEDDQIKEDNITDLVAKDLRAQMKSQGLTGVNYIELDILKDYVNYPSPLSYSWKPSNEVIPSLPSQTDMAISAVQKAISAIDNLNFEDTKRQLDVLISNTNTLVTSLNRTLVGTGDKNPGVSSVINELNKVIGNVNQLTSNKDITNVIQQTSDSITLIRNRLSSSDGDTQMTLQQIKMVSEQLNDLTRALNRHPSGTLLGAPPSKIQIPSNSTSSEATP